MYVCRYLFWAGVLRRIAFHTGGSAAATASSASGHHPIGPVSRVCDRNLHRNRDRRAPDAPDGGSELRSDGGTRHRSFQRSNQTPKSMLKRPKMIKIVKKSKKVVDGSEFRP